MAAFANLAAGQAPEWLAAEMPPGYQTRLGEIQRLMADLGAMDQIGRLLWESGEPLTEAVRDLFGALKCEVESIADLPANQVAVKLDGRRRLLLHVSAPDGTIQRKSDEIAEVFELLQRVAGSDDRVVLVTNADRTIHPGNRPEPLAPDALAFVQRMGVNVVKSADLFKLWRLSHEAQDRALAVLDRLHAQDGGAFQPPAS